MGLIHKILPNLWYRYDTADIVLGDRHDDVNAINARIVLPRTHHSAVRMCLKS